MMYVRTLLEAMNTFDGKVAVLDESNTRPIYTMNFDTSKALLSNPEFASLEIISINLVRIPQLNDTFFLIDAINSDNSDYESERNDIIEFLYHCAEETEIGIYENEGNNFFMSGTVQEMNRHFGQGDIGKRYIISKIWLDDNRINISIKYK